MKIATLNYKAASVRITKARFWRCSYTGVLTNDSATRLGRYARGLIGNAGALDSVIGAVDAVGDLSDGSIAYLKGTKPGAIICRPDQLTSLRGFASTLAGLGVIRVCFVCPNDAEEWMGWVSERPELSV